MSVVQRSISKFSHSPIRTQVPPKWIKSFREITEKGTHRRDVHHNPPDRPQTPAPGRSAHSWRV